jgi:hypothetical protein
MRPSDLRLMPFGRTEFRRVRDGLWEPLWAGRRVLVDVLDDRVTIRDEINDTLEGYAELRESIVECSRADELVLDGYLVPAPIRSTGGAEAPPGMDAVPSAGQMGRQMILGGGSTQAEERRDQFMAERARRVSLPSSTPTGFVAIDLLWIDGQSITDVPLLERKRILESALDDNLIVRRTMAVRPPVEQWFGQWRALGFREMAVKGANSRYTPGKAGDDWAIALIPKR